MNARPLGLERAVMDAREIAERNRRDVVPELREHARMMRAIHKPRPEAQGRLLVVEIAANEIERLRGELERRNRQPWTP